MAVGLLLEMGIQSLTRVLWPVVTDRDTQVGLQRQSWSQNWIQGQHELRSSGNL